jgi:hypothetical protein
MLILAGKHSEGRRAIESVMRMVPEGVSPLNTESQARLLFYANRYLGISYQRDDFGGSLAEAKQHFEKAASHLAAFTGTPEYKELQARLLRNMGNVSLAEKHFTEALQQLEASLKLFEVVGDVEHIGFGHLSIAETLITWGARRAHDAWQHLHQAQSALAQTGNVEGQARVMEQLARYNLMLACQVRRGAKKIAYLREAAALAHTAGKLFDRIGSARLSGRIDGLLGEIEKQRPPSQASQRS